MKQCPSCGSTYADVTQKFCLSDGTALTDPTAGATSAETVVMPGADKIKVPVSLADAPFAAQPSSEPRGISSGNFLKVAVVGIIGVGILALLAIGVGGLVYFNMGRKAAVENTTVISPKDNRDEQIANLKRQLNENKNNQQFANVPAEIPLPNDQPRTARVNSPHDLFLALRSEPNAQTGYQMLKIPHGSLVTIGTCNAPTQIGTKTGRWCHASYGGSAGWVFDAFLIYQ